MNIKEARSILHDVNKAKTLWGRQYDMCKDSVHGTDVIAEAIEVIMEEGQDSADKALDTVKELRAANARLGKLQKRINVLELILDQEVKGWKGKVKKASDKLQGMN